MIIYTIYDYPKKITENIYFHEDMKNSRLISIPELFHLVAFSGAQNIMWVDHGFWSL